tara:strand:+ start:59 stop:460 length:402 start_codon:yes stop_codon:yes gene_type:complete
MTQNEKTIRQMIRDLGIDNTVASLQHTFSWGCHNVGTMLRAAFSTVVMYVNGPRTIVVPAVNDNNVMKYLDGGVLYPLDCIRITGTAFIMNVHNVDKTTTDMTCGFSRLAAAYGIETNTLRNMLVTAFNAENA